MRPKPFEWSSTRRRPRRRRSASGVTASLVILNLILMCGGFVSDAECSQVRESGESNATAPIKSKEEEAVLFRKVFKQMLGLKSLPAAAEKPGGGTMAPPPQYMLELYEKYRNGEINPKGSRKGNTVRSILAIRGNMNGDQMLLFNLSGINSQEELLQGELHFYKRRRVKWPYHSPAPVQYRMKFVGTHVGRDKLTVTSIDTVEVPGRGRGWQVYDVTEILRECRKPTTAQNRQHLLGIKFQALNAKSKAVGLPLNKFVKMNSQPFLIVFTNDQAVNSIENLETHATDFLAADEKEVILTDAAEGDAKNAQETAYREDIRSTANNGTSVLKRGQLKRFARSVMDNELPGNSVYANFLPQTSPNVLQTRNSRRKQKPQQVIPYPHIQTFGKQKKKKGQKSRKRQNRRLPKVWQKRPDLPQQPRHENDATLDVAATAGEEDGNLCRKRKLVVDFADIGWGEWIISPKSFEAHYCSGACPFPLMKNLKPSNHATIQSIVHAIGIHPNVPAPCCVADAMSSVTLLYFDEDRNVVLKNYPSMTVESCACR